MIFISHNHNDKLIIQPIAERLSEIFGRENIFYDSWSIQPGDGIIDRMNEGLDTATHFFFFVSGNSIKSNMVKMEWQNAIFKSSNGKCKVIPIRMDSTSMPAIMAQTLYIDLYSNGIETTISQMVNVIQGNTTYNSSSKMFSNLTFDIENVSENEYHIKVYASHFLEPIPEFLIAVDNQKDDLKFNLPNEGSFYGGFNEGLELNNGKRINVQLMRGNFPITPKHPLIISVETMNSVPFKFLGVMHKTSEKRHDFIPQRR